MSIYMRAQPFQGQRPDGKSGIIISVDTGDFIGQFLLSSGEAEQLICRIDLAQKEYREGKGKAE
jgi:hypothetical protein